MDEKEKKEKKPPIKVPPISHRSHERGPGKSGQLTKEQVALGDEEKKNG